MPFAFSPEQKQTALWLSIGLAFLVLLSLLGPVLMPFLAAAILAYVPQSQWVDRLCARLYRKIQPAPLDGCGRADHIVDLLAIGAGADRYAYAAENRFHLLQAQIPRFLDKMNDRPESRNCSELGISVRLDSAGIKAMLTASRWPDSGDEIMAKAAVLSSIRVGGTAVMGWLANRGADSYRAVLPIAGLACNAGKTSERFVPRRWARNSRDGSTGSRHPAGTIPARPDAW